MLWLRCNGHLQQSAPAVHPWSDQAEISSPKTGNPQSWTEFPEPVCLHRCQCHHRSEGTHRLTATRKTSNFSNIINCSTCVSEFAFEATRSVWLRSSFFCNSSMTTSQLLDVPNKPFAITMMCFLLSMFGVVVAVSGSSCIVHAVLGDPVTTLQSGLRRGVAGKSGTKVLQQCLRL